MIPHDAYNITIHVCTMNIWDISHEKRNEIYFLNKKDIKEPNAIIQLWRNFMWDLSRDLNNTPKTNTNRLKNLGRNWHR